MANYEALSFLSAGGCKQLRSTAKALGSFFLSRLGAVLQLQPLQQLTIRRNPVLDLFKANVFVGSVGSF